MSIAEVVQEVNGTPSNPRLLELQERAREMAKYYCKGFGDSLNAVLNSASLYVRYPDGPRHERWKNDAARYL